MCYSSRFAGFWAKGELQTTKTKAGRVHRSAGLQSPTGGEDEKRGRAHRLCSRGAVQFGLHAQEGVGHCSTSRRQLALGRETGDPKPPLTHRPLLLPCLPTPHLPHDSGPPSSLLSGGRAWAGQASLAPRHLSRAHYLTQTGSNTARAFRRVPHWRADGGGGENCVGSCIKIQWAAHEFQQQWNPDADRRTHQLVRR